MPIFQITSWFKLTSLIVRSLLISVGTLENIVPGKVYSFYPTLNFDLTMMFNQRFKENRIATKNTNNIKLGYKFWKCGSLEIS